MAISSSQTRSHREDDGETDAKKSPTGSKSSQQKPRWWPRPQGGMWVWGGPWGAMGDEPRALRRNNHLPADRRSTLGRQSEHTPKVVIAGLLPCFRKKNAFFPFHKNIHDPSFSWNFLGLSCHVSSLASALTKAISGLRYFLPAMLKRQKLCPVNLSACTRPPVAPLLLNGNHRPLVLAVTH